MGYKNSNTIGKTNATKKGQKGIFVRDWGKPKPSKIKPVSLVWFCIETAWF